jgi:hypothetical protein
LPDTPAAAQTSRKPCDLSVHRRAGDHQGRLGGLPRDRRVLIRSSPRKPGAGGIYELNDHLFEGRYSPTNAQGKREVHTVYAKTKEECEVLLEKMIVEVRERIKEEKRRMKETGATQ